MTPEEFYIEMENIDFQYGHDPEVCRARAEDLMTQTLIGLGYIKGVLIFQHMPEWY